MLLAGPPPADVQATLDAMRADLAAIRAQQDAQWTDARRVESVRATVQDVLADAGTRTSFLQDAGTTGYDHGAYVRSGDGNWKLKVNVLAQERFVAGFAPAAKGVADQNQWGFDVHRINLTLTGNVIDPSVSYNMTLAWNSQPDRFVTQGGKIRLLYGLVRKDWGEGWTTIIGLHNVPWDVESDFFGSSRLTTGEFSVFNYRFGMGKHEGVSMLWQGTDVRVKAGTYSQLNQSSFTWDNPDNLSWAVAARAEVKVGADWDELSWLSSRPGDRPGIVAGLGFVWSTGRAQNPPGTRAAQGFTFDLRGALAGATLLAQYALERDAVGVPDLQWASGLNFQASAFLSPELEPFASGSWMQDAGVPWIVQAGFNWYVAAANAVKLTTKVVVPLGSGQINGQTNIAGGLGVMPAGNGCGIVSQLQLLF